MGFHPAQACCGALLAALLSWPLAGFAAPAAAQSPPAAAVSGAEYHRGLEAYPVARRQSDAAADAYWGAIADKRRTRSAKRRADREILLEDYVLAQPPVYAGPPKPIDPSAPPDATPPPPPPDDKPPPRPYVPVVADFLQAAGRHFNFVPQRPQSEIEYKR